MSVATWLRSVFTTQDPTTYKSAIDGNFAVAERITAVFAPQQAATPNMTVAIRAGVVFSGTTLTEVASQTTTTITAPATNPRIDRIVLDQATGVYSIVTGTPAASPTAPAIPTGKMACAQVLLQTTSTTITNSMITDERCLITVNGSQAATSYAPISFAQIVSISGNTTLTAAQTGMIVYTTAALTATLPTAPATGTRYKIYGSGAGAVIVAGGGANIVLPDASSAASYTMRVSSNVSIVLEFDGTIWRAQTFGDAVVITQTTGNNTTLAASTAFVNATIAAQPQTQPFFVKQFFPTY